MPNRLNIPAELASLIEKREHDDRRASDEGRAGKGRRTEAGEATAGAPCPTEGPFLLDSPATPPDLLERRKDGALREK